MGQITREQVVAVLRRDNPQANVAEVAMYADCFMDYRQAQDNIATHGTIVAHPRTGQPIENPYIKVKATAMNQIRKFTRIKRVSALWT